MRHKRLLWRIYLPFLACTVLALAITAAFERNAVRRFHQHQVAGELLRHARVVAAEIEKLPADNTGELVDPLCKELGRLTLARVTVILPDGRVIGDTDRDPAEMENHRGRPEVDEAIEGSVSETTRFSDTLRETMLYTAIPLRRDGRLAAVVRLSRPLQNVDAALNSIYATAAGVSVVIMTVFALVAWWITRRIARPVENIRATAERLAAGELTARADPSGIAELDALAGSLNRMAGQLGERLETITRQRNEQQAVLASMVEGVLAVDRDQRVLHLNAAAGRLLGLDPARAKGRNLLEVVRHPDLQALIETTLASGGPREAEILMHGEEERVLQLHGTALAGPGDTYLGALVVLNDITRLKRLETMRRDFVANVSHELKTPITAIKGYIETLEGGAADNPEEARRFLAVAARQADRLEAIVEDLLSLSRIEFEEERGELPLEPGPVGTLLERVRQSFAGRAREKRMEITVACPAELVIPMNAPLLEQAVGNLVDNAVKYGREGTAIRIAAGSSNDVVEIRVSDEGPGIEKRHLARIFERFYRVDPARSRTLGGTGLGLGIVKHIALAHRGTVGVESTPGRGSTFTIGLPRAGIPK